MNSIPKIKLITFNNLIHDVYRAETAEAIEQVCLQDLQALISYDAGDFYLAGIEDEHRLTSPVTHNLSLAYAKDYLASYQTQDYARGLFNGHSRVFRESDIIPSGEMMATGYYRKFYQNYGFHYSLHLTVGFNDRFLGVLSLYRKQGPDFSQDDSEILSLLAIHLEACLYAAYRHKRDHREQYPLTTIAAQCHLTPREVSVLRELITDQNNAEIAAHLQITTNTLKKHTANIYQKTGVTNRIQLINLIE